MKPLDNDEGAASVAATAVDEGSGARVSPASGFVPTDDAVETPRGQGACRLKASVSDATAPGIVVTGMGWWLPEQPGPEFGALDVNINAALSYAGPYDPASGSADTRGVPCRILRA